MKSGKTSKSTVAHPLQKKTVLNKAFQLKDNKSIVQKKLFQQIQQSSIVQRQAQHIAQLFGNSSSDNKPQRQTTQFKSSVNINNDKHLEAEADMMGAKALQMKAIPSKSSTQLQSNQGQNAQKSLIIQRKSNNTGLPDNLKSGIENLSGYSMDDVKVHYNSDKPAQLWAHAYAQGTDIHLETGQERHLPHEAWHVVQQKQGRVNSTRKLKQTYSLSGSGKEIQAKFKIGTYQDNLNNTAPIESTEIEDLYKVLGLDHTRSDDYMANLKEGVEAIIKYYRTKYKSLDETISPSVALREFKEQLKNINNVAYNEKTLPAGIIPKKLLDSYTVIYTKHAQNLIHDPNYDKLLPPVGLGPGLNTPLNFTQTDGKNLGFDQAERGLYGMSMLTKTKAPGTEIETAMVKDSTKTGDTIHISGNDDNHNKKILNFLGMSGTTPSTSEKVWNKRVLPEFKKRRKEVHKKFLGINHIKRLKAQTQMVDVNPGVKFSQLRYDKSSRTFKAGIKSFSRPELYRKLTKLLKAKHEKELLEISRNPTSEADKKRIATLKLERAATRSVRNLLKKSDRKIMVITNPKKYHAESAIRRGVKRNRNLSLEKVGGTKAPCAECHTGYTMDNQQAALPLGGQVIGSMYATPNTLAQNEDVNTSDKDGPGLVLESLGSHYQGAAPQFVGGVGDLSMDQVYRQDQGEAESDSEVSGDEEMNAELLHEVIENMIEDIPKST